MRYVLVLALVAACSRSSSLDAGKLLTDRNWVDVWPRDKDQRLHVYRFTPGMGGGVYQDRTLFKGTFELFTYEVRGDSIEWTMPDSGETVKTRFRIDRVDGPRPFDLRLTFEDVPRGPRVYYGRTAEKAGDAENIGGL